MQVPVTQFRARCAELIRKTEDRGEPIAITRHGRMVAILQPTANPMSAARPWEQLRALGGIVRATPEESVLREAHCAASR